eukprot:CAMPEP_0197076868 /NCGR_PEP_ID=MMETSP1384-20130603/212326_1 /TAXON_ID=29189 /ORGANISM="Ammonia sp." /LENGTH=1122 /DNA_ID=CAMNT_0042515727 /DNA_START=113 /DNA_END=3482 /DNA_ORIENTATION=+
MSAQHIYCQNININFNPSAIHEPSLFQQACSIPEGITTNQDYHRTPEWHHVEMKSPVGNNIDPLTETYKACQMLQHAHKLRQKWLYKNERQNGHIGALLQDKHICLDVDKMTKCLPKSMASKFSFRFVDGIARIYDMSLQSERFSLHSFDEYLHDLQDMYSFIEYGPARSLCFNHLEMLQRRFRDHLLLNKQIESNEVQQVPFRDFYTVRKIDNHIHHSACMTQSHLLEFIQRKFEQEPDKVVSKDGKTLKLEMLQRRFRDHLLLNKQIESNEVQQVPFRDFYTVRKIDNHIHHSACMTQSHLLEFIQRKFEQEPDKVVSKDGKTLKQVFEALSVNPQHISIDSLDVHAEQSTFHRFDKFNTKYNPIGEKTLKDVFIKVDNAIDGEYSAQLTKEVFQQLEATKYQYAELRISIGGKHRRQWDVLSDWICRYQLKSTQIRWLIQTPRKYHVLKEANAVRNFHDMLANIFEPLFEVTIDPSSHPSLHLFLQIVVGFDSVDDESVPGFMESTNYATPACYDSNINPSYIYYMYYMWVNITKLNKLREERGMNTFAFRPHSGEAGPVSHLASTFLLAHSINHGIRLNDSPVLQYLYYLEQIPISVAPLSNNILFKEHSENPFPSLFERGLNVALSTDDPLIIHFSPNPLLEEYTTAAHAISSHELIYVRSLDLASTFLLAHSINHGIRLNDSPVLQYLYYLEQIPISVAPLSNNILFKEHSENPFPSLFERGLNVALSTDDPLIIHFSPNPLLEEYTTAAHAYKLSRVDLCEIARNSVLQCGWDEVTKQRWIGQHYNTKEGAEANDIYRTNVPNTRLQFRHYLLTEERAFVAHYAENENDEDTDFDEEGKKTQLEDDMPLREVIKTDLDTVFNLQQQSSNLCGPALSKQTLFERFIYESEYFQVYEFEEKVIGFVCGTKENDDCASLRLQAIVMDPNLCGPALSKQTLFERFIYESEYFQVYEFGEKVIGFVCGTKENDDCASLRLQAIVMDQRYKQLAVNMLTLYIDQVTAMDISPFFFIKLTSQKPLFPLYEECGFVLMEQTEHKDVEHDWYEMQLCSYGPSSDSATPSMSDLPAPESTVQLQITASAGILDDEQSMDVDDMEATIRDLDDHSAALGMALEYLI